MASTRGPAQVLPSCHHAHGKLNIVVLFYSLGLAICPFLFLAFVTSDVSAVGCIVTVAASLLLFHLVLLFVLCQLLEHENKRIFPESSIFEVAMASTQTNMLLLFMELSNCTMMPTDVSILNVTLIHISFIYLHNIYTFVMIFYTLVYFGRI